eukprot:12245684-Alexandrium_andersonii.AAC.1
MVDCGLRIAALTSLARIAACTRMRWQRRSGRLAPRAQAGPLHGGSPVHPLSRLERGAVAWAKMPF